MTTAQDTNTAAPTPDEAPASLGPAERLLLGALAMAGQDVLLALNRPGETPAFRAQLSAAWRAVGARLAGDAPAGEAGEAAGEAEMSDGERVALANVRKAGEALKGVLDVPGVDSPTLRREILRIWTDVGDHMEGRCACGRPQTPDGDTDGGQTPAPSGFLLIRFQLMREAQAEGDGPATESPQPGEAP